MIKNYGRRKLSRTSAHRRALLRNLAIALFQHEKVTTTLPKAKELARFSEKLITLARPGNLIAQRAISKEIHDKNVKKKLFEVLVPRYQNRSGGYTQVFRLGLRRGDNAKIAVIRLVV